MNQASRRLKVAVTGAVPVGSGPPEFSAYIKSELAK